MMMAEMRIAKAATPVATGEQTVRVDVTVTYRLVDAVGEAARVPDRNRTVCAKRSLGPY